jgi:metallo-beta-lactamase class B
MFKNIVFATFLLLSSLFASAQTVNEPKNTPTDWSKPYPPFRIAGNLYYVGTYDLACYLIVTPKGNILVNTGLANSLSIIKNGIETLGFKLKDTKILLTMQAHYDHMGAIAAIKKLTGAKMIVDEPEAEVMANGGSTDYALGDGKIVYEPVKADRLLHNGDTIILGGMQIVMLHHPGHTKGSCSFLFDVKDEQRTYRVLLANMPTIVTSKNFNNIPAYPNIAQDYQYTLKAMKRLSFDLWFAAHASQFNLLTKHQPGDAYKPEAFRDQDGYDTQITELQTDLDKKLKTN